MKEYIYNGVIITLMLLGLFQITIMEDRVEVSIPSNNCDDLKLIVHNDYTKLKCGWWIVSEWKDYVDYYRTYGEPDRWVNDWRKRTKIQIKVLDYSPEHFIIRKIVPYYKGHYGTDGDLIIDYKFTKDKVKWSYNFTHSNTAKHRIRLKILKFNKDYGYEFNPEDKLYYDKVGNEYYYGNVYGNLFIDPVISPIDDVWITPDPANSTSDLTCNYNFTSGSSDVYVGWFINDNFVYERNDYDILNYENTSGEDNVICQAKPFNSTTNGTAVNSTSLYINPYNFTNLSIEGYTTIKKFEMFTTPEISCEYINDTLEADDDTDVCIGIGLKGYGANFSCGNGSVKYNFTIPFVEQNNFLSNNYIDGNGTIQHSLYNWSEVVNTTFDVSSNQSINNLIIELVKIKNITLLGTLLSNQLEINSFTDGSKMKEYNLFSSFTSSNNVNLSTYGTFDENATLIINATNANPSELDYQERWINESNFNVTGFYDAELPTFMFDDLETEVDGRWNYDTTGGGDSYYDSPSDRVYSVSSISTNTVESAFVNSMNLDLNSTNQRVDIRTRLYGHVSSSGNLVGYGKTILYLTDDDDGIDNKRTLYRACVCRGLGSCGSICGGSDPEVFSGTVSLIKKPDGDMDIYVANTYYKTITPPASGGEIGVSTEAKGDSANGATGTSQGDIRYIRYGGIGNNYTTDVNGFNFSTGNFTAVSNILLNSSPSDTISITPTYNLIEPSGCDVRVYVSADNGTNWQEGISGNQLSFTNPGEYIKYNVTLQVDSTNNVTPCALHNIELDVASTSPENLTIYIEEEDNLLANYIGTLNETNTPITLSMNKTALNEYISDSCTEEEFCNIPLIFEIEIFGSLTAYDLNFTKIMDDIYINGTLYNNYLSNCVSDNQLLTVSYLSYIYNITGSNVYNLSNTKFESSNDGVTLEPESSLIFNFDENDTSNNIIDHSYYNNSGVSIGDISFNETEECVNNRCVDLDGDGDVIFTNKSFKYGNNVSMMMWLNVKDSDEVKVVIGEITGVPYYGITNSEVPTLRYGGSPNYYNSECGVLSLNTWYHLAFTSFDYNSTHINATLYRDGVSCGSSIFGTNTKSWDEIQIGAFSTGLTNELNASIDELYILNYTTDYNLILSYYNGSNYSKITKYKNSGDYLLNYTSSSNCSDWSNLTLSGLFSNSSSPYRETTDEDLLLYLTLDNTPKDLLGYNNGVITGNVYNSTSGINNSLYFDGLNGKVTVDYSDRLNFTGDDISASWGAWAKSSLNTQQPSTAIFRATFDSFGLFASNNDYACSIVNSSEDTLITSLTNNLFKGEWIFHICTANSTHLCHYMDGELNDCENYDGSIRTGWPDLNVGAEGSANRYFNGNIDELFLYNKSLSGDEVKEWWRKTSARYTYIEARLSDDGSSYGNWYKSEIENLSNGFLNLNDSIGESSYIQIRPKYQSYDSQLTPNINVTEIEFENKSCLNYECTVNTTISNNNNSRITFDDLSVKHYGNGNISINCSNQYENKNLTMITRYSPFRLYFSKDNLNYLVFNNILTGNDKNVSPFGQRIGNERNISILKFLSESPIHNIDLFALSNASLNQSQYNITITSNSYNDKSFILNENTQGLFFNNSYLNSVDVYMFLDLYNATSLPVLRWWNMFVSYCSDTGDGYGTCLRID